MAKQPAQRPKSQAKQRSRPQKILVRLAAVLILLVVLFNPFTQTWLAERFVVDDGLAHSDIVVALRSDSDEATVRVDEAVTLVQQHYAPLLLADVSVDPIYGIPEAQLFDDYVKKKGVAPSQTRRCDNAADSTSEEAVALRSCLLKLGVKEVLVVTSEYHTRRARSILRNAFTGIGIVLRVHPVYNHYYWDVHWWRNRRWAKTFFLESTKSIWAVVEQIREAIGSSRR